jgi:hypothetical protein
MRFTESQSLIVSVFCVGIPAECESEDHELTVHQ